MFRKLYEKIFKKKGIDMNILKVADLPFELDKTVRIKVLHFGEDSVKFIHRGKNSEDEITILKPKNKSWKKININPGAKINVKLVRGKKNGSPQLLVV